MKRHATESQLALAAALLTVLLWASAFVGIRAAGRGLGAGPLSLARLLVGSAALGAVVLARREPLPPRRDYRGLLVCGLLWFGAYNVMLNQAEHLVDAGTAAMLVNIGPVLIALLGGWILREGFPRRLVVGCALAFLGSIVIGLATSARGLSAGLGSVLCVGAAVAYAGGVVSEKPLLSRSSALTVTWIACSIGAVACLPFLPQLVGELGHAGTSALLWALYLGLLPTAAGFSLWGFALARTSAGRLGATTYLVPPLAILLGWLMLGDVPPLLALAGGVLCLFGVAVTRGLRVPGRFHRPAPLEVPPA